MSLIEQLNGAVMKAAAMFGFAAVAYLVLIVLAWIGQQTLGLTMDETWKTVSSIIVILLGGSAGAKYVTSHDVSKKE